MNEKKQADAFLDDIKKDSIVLDDDGVAKLFEKKEVTQPKEQAEKVEPEEDEDKPKVRRYRRLEEKYQKEREANIALQERIKVLSETERYQKENEGEIDPDLIKAFGTTEDGKALTNIFSKKFKEVQSTAEANAERRVMERMAEQESKASEQEAIESETIDQAFDNIEDKFGVDLSGKSKASKDFRNGFIDFVEQISPKDKDGDIIEYADFETAYETYSKLASNTKPREVSERQKELASRGMTRSANTAAPEAPKGLMSFNKLNKYIDSLRNQ